MFGMQYGATPGFSGIGGPQLTPQSSFGGSLGFPQQQVSPQGFFGNLLGQVGQPLGSAIGSMLSVARVV